MRKSVLVLLLVLLVLVSITACFFAKSPQEQIIGKWKMMGQQNTILEFYKDGMIILTDSGFSIRGRYIFLDKEQVQINLEGIWGTVGSLVGSISFHDDALYWATGSSTVFFNRVKQ